MSAVRLGPVMTTKLLPRADERRVGRGRALAATRRCRWDGRRDVHRWQQRREARAARARCDDERLPVSAIAASTPVMPIDAASSAANLAVAPAVAALVEVRRDERQPGCRSGRACRPGSPTASSSQARRCRVGTARRDACDDRDECRRATPASCTTPASASSSRRNRDRRAPTASRGSARHRPAWPGCSAWPAGRCPCVRRPRTTSARIVARSLRRHGFGLAPPPARGERLGSQAPGSRVSASRPRDGPGSDVIQPSRAANPPRAAASRPAAWKSAGRRAGPAERVHAERRPTAASRPARRVCRRSASSIRGMSIRTGHTSRQAPHRLLACGRSSHARRGRAAPASAPRRPARVDAAVRVPADLLIDRAGVQAGAAADAVEDLGQLAARAPCSGRCRRARRGAPRGRRARRDGAGR